MNRNVSRWMLAAMVSLCIPAQARDTRYLLKIADVLAMPEASGRLDPQIRFYFGTKKAPPGEDRGQVVVNPKTNASNKSDEWACQWVMLSALMELQKKARQVGANAIVGIESYYRKVVFTSQTEYECHAGAWVAGVALRGKLVRTR